MKKMSKKRKILYAIYAVLAVIVILIQFNKYKHQTMTAEITQITDTKTVVCCVDEAGNAVAGDTYELSPSDLPDGVQQGDRVTITFVRTDKAEPGQFDAVISVEKSE